MKRIFSFIAAFALLASALPVHAATLSSGDLIKASGQAVYYYGTDGKRYVFPTEKTYLSWYADFSGVKTITDNELAAISIGGNVTYKPGVRLVKVTTDPRVYAVDGRQLRWVQSEQAAQSIFGDDWAKQVDDIPDAFFVNYTLGSEIDTAADFAPASVRAFYANIQATLDTSSPTPAPTPTPTPDPTPTPTPTPSSSLNLTLTTDKMEAQPNEPVFVVAQTTATSSIDRLELYADDGLMTTCHAISCSGTWTIPVAGVKDTYVFSAKLYLVNGGTANATTNVSVTSTPLNVALQLTANRTTIRPDELAHIRALSGTGLTSQKTDIYLDGNIIKSCSSTQTPDDCKYDNYLSGDIGTTHVMYAIVRTPSSLYYKSNAITLTIGNNDSPMLSLVAGNTDIYTGESVDVTATAQDDDGVNQVQIMKDGAVLKTCTGAAPCTITTGPWSTAATLTFQATATDLLGAASSATTTVTVH